uniref:Uncharacterized protein n=1 Tax=Anguilla anguilla TaxID=7936 RepID=A0A0E9WPD2_ANGAN
MVHDRQPFHFKFILAISIHSSLKVSQQRLHQSENNTALFCVEKKLNALRNTRMEGISTTKWLKNVLGPIPVT